MSDVFKTKKIDTREGDKKKDSAGDIKAIKNLYDQDKDALDKPRNFTKVVIFMILLATLSGLIAGFIAVVSLFSGGLGYLGIKTEDIFPTQNITLENKETINVFEDEQLTNVLQANHKSLVYIFPKKKPSDDILSNIYLERNALASAFVITDDGWLVSSSALKINEQASYVAITFDDQVLDVEKIIQDPFSKIFFIKLKNSSGLTSVSLGSNASLENGSKLLAMSPTRDGYGKMSLVRLVEKNWLPVATSADLVQTDKEVVDYLLLETNSELVPGSPVSDLKGDIVGIIDRQQAGGFLVKKIEDFNPALNRVLNGEEKWTVSSIGLSYLDLENTYGGSVKMKKGDNLSIIESGNLVIAVTSGSTAEAAGILAGDVIIKIDSQNITSDNSLGAILQKYKADDIIVISILREGEAEELLLTVEVK